MQAGRPVKPTSYGWLRTVVLAACLCPVAVSAQQIDYVSCPTPPGGIFYENEEWCGLAHYTWPLALPSHLRRTVLGFRAWNQGERVVPSSMQEA